MPPSNLLLASKVVTVLEAPSIRNIPAAPTSIIGFSGVTERGPVGVPQFVTSYDEWVEIFGSFIAESDLAVVVQAAFQNGATAVWTSRVVHYTDINDSNTSTAAKGSQTLQDRGGVAGPAVLDSDTGTFDLEPGEQLDVNIDGAGTDSLVFTATPAEIVTDPEPIALVDGMTLVYQTRLPGQTSLTEEQTIEFLTADFAAIGAATADEIADVINRDGQGISAEVTGGGTTVTVRSDKRGSNATIVLSASSTALAALGLVAGSTNGSGNVADIDAVTPTEVAALLTGLPLSAGTAVVAAVGGDNVVRLTSTATGSVGASVVIEATTTALGIFVGALPITEPGTDAAESPAATIQGRDPGEFIENYSVVIEPATSGDSDRFNLRVKKGTATVETWPNLSMVETDDRYAETFIANNSRLIDFIDLFSPATPPNNMPKLGEFSAWAGADDGLTGLVDADFTGSEAGQTGLYAFDIVRQLTLLAVPGRATAAVHNAMIAYCQVHRVESCFAILDSPEGLDEQQIKNYVEVTAGLGNISEFAMIAAPRVQVLNPSTAVFGAGERLTIPASGSIAGLFTRQDASAPGGIYTAAANPENGVLFGVVGLEGDDPATGAKSWVRDERKRDVVYPARINPITVFDGTPFHLDGSRTLKGDGNFPSIPETRGVIFIRQSVKNGLLFAKHRNNNRRLRMEVKRSIEAFLLIQFGNDAFRGDTPSESFKVDASDALNTIERVFAGQLHVRVGLATNKPSEFIVVTFTQDTRALEERLQQALGA